MTSKLAFNQIEGSIPSIGDYPSVQAAVDANSVLYVDQIYTITTPIELPIGRDTTFIGSDRNVSGFIAGAEVTDATATLFKMGNVVDQSVGDGTERIEFRDLTIDCVHGTYANNDHCFFGQTLGSFYTYRCEFKNGGGALTYAQGVQGEVKQVDCVFNTSTSQGLYLKSTSQYGIVQGCYFNDIAAGGPTYVEEGTVSVDSCIFVDCAQGPNIRKNRTSTNKRSASGITNCTVINCTDRGITYGNSGDNWVVAGNNVICYGSGIDPAYGINIDLVKNVYPSEDGPYGAQANGRVYGNNVYIYDSATCDDGIRLTGVKKAKVFGNIVEGTSRYGIFSNRFCENISIRDNDILNFTGDGVNIEEFENSTLNGAITDLATSLILTDASAFPNAGNILINEEEISYTGKSVNTLTGLTRGINGTTAVAHSDTDPVYLDASVTPPNVVVQSNTFLPDPTASVDYIRSSGSALKVIFKDNICYGDGGTVVPSNAKNIVDGNVFPDVPTTTNVFNTGKAGAKNVAVLETTSSPALSGNFHDDIFIDTTSGGKNITLPPISVIGYGQKMRLHKPVASSALTINTDGTDQVDDGTTSGITISNIIDNTEVGVLELVSSKVGSTDTWFVTSIVKS